MAFVIRNNKQRLEKPEGIYLMVKGIEWLVKEVKMTPSGNIVVMVHDPVRLENQIFTACNISDLGKLIGED